MNKAPALMILLMITIITPAVYLTHVWVGTCMNTTMVQVERAIQIQSVAFNSNTNDVTVYVQNVGYGSVGITDVHLDGVRQTITVLDSLTEGGTTQLALGEGRSWEVINVDGDISLPAVEDRKFWNPHVYGFSPEIEWNISFDETVSITLQTSDGEGGHVATGMWWISGFEEGIKIPLNNLGIQVEFDVKVSKFTYEASGDWLRIALACAVQRSNGEVVYTELDFLDSPGTLQHEKGNILLGGDVIYQFGDVVEFRIDEIPLQEWRHYQIDLTSYIERAWKISEGDRLESVYIVVESDRSPVDVMLEVDNLWIFKDSKLFFWD